MWRYLTLGDGVIRKERRFNPLPSYGRTVNEPLVGAPLLKVLVNGSCDGSFVGVVPQWITAVKVNVSPICDESKVWVKIWLLMFLFGVSVNTCEVRVKPFTPTPSTPVIVTLA